MSALSPDVELDYSVEGLFPNKDAADQDPKCKIIAEIIQSFSNTADMTGVTQADLQTHAQHRYTFISKEEKLSLPNADHLAFLLYQKGVSSETAQSYISFRLTETDAKRWTIIK
jgi:hypothetical protein